MRGVILLSLLLPLCSQAGHDTAVTLALIQAIRSAAEDNAPSFSPVLLLTPTSNKASRYPHFLPPLNIPVHVTSSFSMRWHPILHRFSAHNGTDFAAPRLTPVLATEKGTVAEAGYSLTAGIYIVLSHPQGWESRYLHLDKLNVTEGQQISRGNVIAWSGSTGRSTGPHLHFELAYQGQRMDSEKLLQFAHHVAELPVQTAPVAPPTPVVPKIMLVTEIAGQEKVMVKYKGRTIYASADQKVFGTYKVVFKNRRYRLQKMF